MKIVQGSHVLGTKSANKDHVYVSLEKNHAETAVSVKMHAAQMMNADQERNVNQVHAHLIAQT